MVLPTAWPFLPNWADGITERLSWLTAIQTSRSGAEQRQALRVWPRRQIDYPVLLTDQERSYFDVLTARNGGVAWNMPLPHEEIQIGAVAQGDTTFAVDTAYREIAVGMKLLLRGSDAMHSELVEVTSMTSSTITTTAATKTYFAATLTPTVLAVITEKVDLARRTARVQTGTVRFNVVEPTVWPISPRALAAISDTTFASNITPSYPVLKQQPNAINDLTYTYERMWATIDNSQSLPQYIDKAGRQFMSQQYEWFLYGRKERQDFRDLLMLLRGRCKPLWVPTFNDDLAYGQGYPDPAGFGTPPPGREFYAQFLLDGSVHVYPNAPYASGDRIPGLVFSAATVQRTSFLSLKRLDVDDIEIVHHTAADGVATVSALFRDAPDLRQPLTFDPLGYGYSGYYQGINNASTRTAVTNSSTGLTDVLTITGTAGGAS